MTMKLKVSSKSCEDDPGILYLVEFELEGKTLIKIGVTTRKIEDRMTEILTSIFKKYREFPYCRPKRFRQTDNVYEKESILHEYFKEYNYVPSKKFSGSTEFFEMELDYAVKVYEDLLDGKDINGGQE